MTDLASILSDRLAEGAFALVLILLMLQVGVLLVTLRLRFSIPRLLRTALPLLLCFLPFAVFVSLPRQIRELSLPVLCRDPDSLIRLPAALYLGSIVLSLLMLGIVVSLFLGISKQLITIVFNIPVVCTFVWYLIAYTKAKRNK